MSTLQAVITILVMAVVTLLTRALPFLLFPAHKETPRYIVYLGQVLPCATIGLLVIFCLKGLTPATWPHGLPELIAVAAVALLQLWRRNTLVSIVGGTLFYMLLVQVVFV